MTDYNDLITRLELHAKDASTLELYGLAQHLTEAAACIREMVEVENDAIQKREGLEEDLYQAVLVAYRRGAVEWTRLNYPQWFAAISSGREVCPLPSAPNQAKEAGE